MAADKGYDTKDFVAGVRDLGFTPHVAQNNKGRRSAIDGRTTRHAGHVVSLRIRKRVEEPFGWIKTVGAGRKVRYIGQERNRAWFKVEAAVYNLIRICSLDAAAIAQSVPDRALIGSRAKTPARASPRNGRSDRPRLTRLPKPRFSTSC